LAVEITIIGERSQYQELNAQSNQLEPEAIATLTKAGVVKSLEVSTEPWIFAYQTSNRTDCVSVAIVHHSAFRCAWV
jgi:hypothetical protein